MSSKVEMMNVKFDIFKLALSVLIVISGIVGFYFFADQSVLFRTIGLLICASVSLYIAFQTDKGRNAWMFFQDAQIEVRKVVWPTRQETVQTTLIVILVVIIVAIILWLLDMFLGWSVRNLLGRG
ncbi:MAG: preprotein translocase subunit SecE [bacterium]|jgi:preprotein translocase subunit SecE